jgi:hypothetical protein
MELSAFRHIVHNVDAPLRELFSFALRHTYTTLACDQISEGQYWLLSCMTYVISPAEENLPALLQVQESRMLRAPLFCMQSDTARMRSHDDVTGFFRENDTLFEDLIWADDHCQLEFICSLLDPAFVDIEAKFRSPNGVSNPLLEEDICLIEPTDLSCMINERYWVRVPCSSGFTYHRVPFDKADLLAGAVRVPRPPRKRTGRSHCNPVRRIM